MRPTKNSFAAYKNWQAMRARCLTTTNNMYPKYGGRGITIDPRWEDFWTFLEDMGERPDGHSLDRIDNSKGYSKSNCRWATSSRQNRNRSHHELIEFNGKAQTLADWSDEIGVNRSALSWRFRLGWSVAKALTTPIPENKRRRIAKAA